jgi:hypothetical protein
VVGFTTGSRGEVPGRKENLLQEMMMMMMMIIIINYDKTIILPVVLYECETWSLTSREGHRLSVFENRFLRRISEPKRDNVTGEWKKLHNEELHNLYSSASIIRQISSRKMRWVEHMARMGEEIKCTRFWWESPKERYHSEDRGVDGRI